MDSITLGQIAAAVAFLVVLIGGISTLNANLKKYLTAMMKSEIEPLKTTINEIDSEIKKVDMNACKNYLVRFLSDVEKGNVVDEVERQRFYEQYEHYISKGGNGYIHHKVESIEEKKLL